MYVYVYREERTNIHGNYGRYAMGTNEPDTWIPNGTERPSPDQGKGHLVAFSSYRYKGGTLLTAVSEWCSRRESYCKMHRQRLVGVDNCRVAPLRVATGNCGGSSRKNNSYYYYQKNDCTAR
jgi:hypothetical protein